MDAAVRAIMAIVASIISLAILSVILSKNSQTSTVISDATAGLSSIIKAAESPV
jgi:hypothetical protein